MRIHVVQKGDSLSKIAKKYDVDHDALRKMNRQLTSPDSLKPGMKVKVPTGGFPIKKTKPRRETAKRKRNTPERETQGKTKTEDVSGESSNVAVSRSQADESNEAMGGSGDQRQPSSGENWSFHYPPDRPLNQGLMNEWPQVAGDMNRPEQGMEIPGYPFPFGTDGGDFQGSPRMPDHSFDPGFAQGANGMNMWPTPNAGVVQYPGAMSNPMYPENMFPANGQPNMSNAMQPNGMIPMGYPCHCGSPVYGYPWAGMPYMPANSMVSPQMTSQYQPEFWEPNNAGFQGMVPAGSREDENDDTD